MFERRKGEERKLVYRFAVAQNKMETQQGKALIVSRMITSQTRIVAMRETHSCRLHRRTRLQTNDPIRCYNSRRATCCFEVLVYIKTHTVLTLYVVVHGKRNGCKMLSLYPGRGDV